MIKSFLLPILAACLCICGVRLCCRALLFKKKLNKSLAAGLIPFKSELDLFAIVHEQKRTLIGMICKVVAFVSFVGTFFVSEYANTLASIHVYGIILENYSIPQSLQILQYCLLGIFVIAFLMGIALRLMAVRTLMPCFGGRSPVMHFLGMILPGVFYLVLAFSRNHPFLLNKKLKDMTRDEYLLYTHITDK